MGPIARDAAEQSKNKAVIEIDPPLDLQLGDDGRANDNKEREKAQLEGHKEIHFGGSFCLN